MRTKITSALICLGLFLMLAGSVSAQKTYGQPGLSDKPRFAHILQNEGGFFRYEDWLLTIAPRTFDYDIYYQHGCWKKSFPIRIGRYWQVSDICEFWPRSHFNGATAERNKPWIISFRYDDNDLLVFPGLYFPESALKIVYSPDGGNTWTMLRSSIVDTENNTVAALTSEPGGFMVMSGFVAADTYYDYTDPSVLGLQSDSAEIQSAGVLSIVQNTLLKLINYIFSPL